MWSSSCQEAFEKVKFVLLSTPVVLALNFQKKSFLMVDTSGVGAGAVLMQSDQRGSIILFVTSPASLIYLKETIRPVEKEILALVLAL